MHISTQHIKIQSLKSKWLQNISADVLRLDLIHPVVSGNKWFKLKYQIEEAVKLNCIVIATFGGAFSNHIVATAFACKEMGIDSVGFIRGEQPKQLSHTLEAASNFGMKLIFVSRDDYANKEVLQLNNKFTNCYWIEEGGYSLLGAKGASEILQNVNAKSYTHILCSCGTGTMMAGLVSAALPHQIVIGISALKGHLNLKDDVKKLLPANKLNHPFTILHEYHFGGYAKHPKQLIDWMNELYQQENLPTDIVYTSKLLFAVKDLCGSNYFAANSKLLIIHSGGLQGNLSLPSNTLTF